jgi:ribonuclease-3
MEQNDLIFIQSQIGYTFNNLDLLQQAFVRRSYSQENGGENNEVLEFVGDKVLDFFAVKFLTEKYGFFLSDCDDHNAENEFDEFASEKTEAELTDAKKMLVQKNTLSSRIDILQLADYLIMGKGDLKNNAHKEASVKEDLFEAILGAVAIDSNWDPLSLQSVVEIMLDPESILCNETESYVAFINDWYSKEYHSYPEFKYGNSSYYDEACLLMPANEIRSKIERDHTFHIINVQEYYRTHFKCWLDLFDKRFIGYGLSKSLARKDLCRLIYSYLEEKSLLHSIHDEIENPNRNDAINQLEILARRGYFSIPTYEFEQAYDIDGNPVWKSVCHIAEERKAFSAKSSSKKDAKKSAAFQMLQYVLKD